MDGIPVCEPCAKTWEEWAVNHNIAMEYVKSPAGSKFPEGIKLPGMRPPWELIKGVHEYILYRCYGQTTELLYIGSTCYFHNRIKQHSKSTPWWHDVDCIVIERHQDLQTLRQHEYSAIRYEYPLHNKIRYRSTGDR
jgi:hypothetical protein